MEDNRSEFLWGNFSNSVEKKEEQFNGKQEEKGRETEKGGIGEEGWWDAERAKRESSKKGEENHRNIDTEKRMNLANEAIGKRGQRRRN